MIYFLGLYPLMNISIAFLCVSLLLLPEPLPPPIEELPDEEPEELLDVEDPLDEDPLEELLLELFPELRLELF